MIQIDYERLRESVDAGTLRIDLEQELTAGFRAMQEKGEPIPPASYLATKIAEIMNRESEEELSGELAFDVYQEVVTACENARAAVLGDEPKPN